MKIKIHLPKDRMDMCGTSIDYLTVEEIKEKVKKDSIYFIIDNSEGCECCGSRIPDAFALQRIDKIINEVASYLEKLQTIKEIMKDK
jgi:hypothetical protein